METAYKAVMKPKEGTILTVAKEAAAKACEIAGETDDLLPFFETVFAHAEETLARTPDTRSRVGFRRPGSYRSFKRRHRRLSRQRSGLFDFERDRRRFFCHEDHPRRRKPISSSATAPSSSSFWIMRCRKRKSTALKNSLHPSGDSIVLVADDEIVKVHVHTNHPARPLNGLSHTALFPG